MQEKEKHTLWKRKPVIILKSETEIKAMKASGKLASETLDFIAPHVKAGVSTLELDTLCHEFMVSRNAIPAPLNYRGFPKSVCTSINEVVCHGIPKEKDILKDGDIINIDVTTILEGFHGDTSRMFMVGSVSEAAKRLVETTKQCMYAGIDAVKIGNRIGDIGHAIQSLAESKGYSVVREFVGHGIGRIFHEEPQIFHYGKPRQGTRIEAGMVFTIEPMINEGVWRTKMLSDGWTAITADGKLSAQYEHTIAVHHDGNVEILTQS